MLMNKNLKRLEDISYADDKTVACKEQRIDLMSNIVAQQLQLLDGWFGVKVSPCMCHKLSFIEQIMTAKLCCLKTCVKQNHSVKLKLIGLAINNELILIGNDTFKLHRKNSHQ